jgi:hypothetical protein
MRRRGEPVLYFSKEILAPRIALAGLLPDCGVQPGWKDLLPNDCIVDHGVLPMIGTTHQKNKVWLEAGLISCDLISPDWKIAFRGVTKLDFCGDDRATARFFVQYWPIGQQALTPRGAMACSNSNIGPMSCICETPKPHWPWAKLGSGSRAGCLLAITERGPSA